MSMRLPHNAVEPHAVGRNRHAALGINSHPYLLFHFTGDLAHVKTPIVLYKKTPKVP